MPLRDHFRGPTFQKAPWERLLSDWPMTIAGRLNTLVPPRYAAAPHVQSRSADQVEWAGADDSSSTQAHSGDECAHLWRPSEPTLVAEVDPRHFEEFSVRVYDRERGRRLVVVVELFSPSNKDCLKRRSTLIARYRLLLQQRVSVVLVDVATTRTGNLYVELLESFGIFDAESGSGRLYTAALRRLPYSWRVETWAHDLAIGALLPTLPLWLTPDHAVPLELEASYEDACRGLRIP